MIDQRARDMAPPDRGRAEVSLPEFHLPLLTDLWVRMGGTVGTSDWTCYCGESLKNVPKPLNHYAKET